METLNRRRVLKVSLVGAATAAWLPAPVMAQASGLPRIVKIVVPLAAGGAVDNTARRIAEQMGKLSGSTFVIENKPGAAGLIAAQAVAGAAEPATLLYATSGLVTVQAMTGRLDILKEFKPVSKISSGSFLLVVQGSSNFRTLDDLIAAAHARPGALNFGSAGNGSPIHLIHEVMADKVVGGFKVTNIPFKGGSIEAVLSLLGGQIDFTYGLPGAVSEHIKLGKLRALAVTSAKRSPLFPQVPTFAESGVPGFKRDSWSGLMLPAKAPDELVQRLNSLVTTAVQTPEIMDLFAREGAISEVGDKPAQFSEELRLELDAERALIVKLGLKA